MSFIDQQINFKISELEEMLAFINSTLLPNDLAPESLTMINGLEIFFKNFPQFASQHPAVYQKLQQALVKLQWVALPGLALKAVLSMFTEHFAAMFEIPSYDLGQKFEAKLVSYIHPQRDEIKDQVKTILLHNKEVLTDEGVIIGTHEQSGTVQNWLNDYNQRLGTNKVDGLQITNYIVEHLRDYSPEDRRRVEILVHFYERLKYSSIDEDGVEDAFCYVDPVDQKQKVFHHGVVEDPMADNHPITAQIEDFKRSGLWPDSESSPTNVATTPPTPHITKLGPPAFAEATAGKPALTISVSADKPPLPPPPAKNLAIQAEPTTDFHPALTPRPINLDKTKLNQTSNEMLDEYNKLPVALSTIQQQIRVILERLSQDPKVISKILSSPEKVKDQGFVVAALLLASQRGELAADKNPDQLAGFIREILEQKLHWTAADSAKLGIRVGAILGGQYRTLAFYDKVEKQFKWHE